MTSLERPRPQSIREVFVTFSLLALQGFGGVLAFIEREMVEKKKWLTRAEFIEEWAVARTMPGPPALNIAVIVGSRYFGWRGAVAAVVGMFAMPSVIVLLLAVAYTFFGHHPEVIASLRGMGAVAAGLITATGIKLLSALKTNVLGPVLCTILGVASFVGTALFQWRMTYILFGLGGIACVIAYLKIKDVAMKNKQ